MPLAFQSLAAVRDAPFDTLIDVRSPAEYAEDHIPGAINLPVLSDEERARVGTIYVRDAPFTARKIGAALVARNAARHIEGALSDKQGGWRPLVYCWRGGQRSGAFASILAQIGWRAETVEGGYRSYRRLVAEAMHDRALPHRLVLLDGYTGTAKTELLGRVAARGVQVVDLEGLAAHRGSVFGGVAAPQPSQKAFEGRVAWAFERLDPARPVLVEAESSRIGAVLVPPSVWAAMRAAPRLEATAAPEARARYLVRAYADLIADPAALAATLELLIPLQGRGRVTAWQAMAAEGRFETLAGELMAEHYDPRYAKSRPGDCVRAAVPLGAMRDADLDRAADALAREVERLA